MIYFDNAATTPLDERVFEAMKPYLLEHFGNPSSTHALGRQVKVALEEARKSIASLLKCHSSEIFFTSCATEANNAIIKGVVDKMGVKHIITSKLEHHAVLQPAEDLAKRGLVELHYVNNDSQGAIDLGHLEELLKSHECALVSIMHANNELGNVNAIEEIGELCKQNNALFHSDTVQTAGHNVFDLEKFPIDYMVASAHKFHGPKGVGFMFVRKEKRFSPLVSGGAQEKELRAGTENVASIIGMTEAFELAQNEIDVNEVVLKRLKSYLVDELMSRFDCLTINGTVDSSLNNILSLSISPEKTSTMLLFSLDMKGIALSGGSACGSGAVSSHVMEAIHSDPKAGVIRISLSRLNTKEEIDVLVKALEEQFK